MISKELLDVLCCPIDNASLKQKEDNLICAECGVAFPIKDGIPILLIDEAVLPDGIKEVSELKCRKTKHDS